MTKTRLYFTLAVIYAALGVAGFYWTGRTGDPYWAPVLTLLVLHAMTSWKTVSESEMAVSILFGNILDDLKSGLHFVPYPMRMTKVSKNDIKVHFGTLEVSSKQNILNSADSISNFVVDGAVRIHFGEWTSAPELTDDERLLYRDDPLAQRLTVDPHLYFIFFVYDLKKLITEAGGLKEAIDRIIDSCTTALTDMAGKTIVAKATTMFDVFNQKMLEEVEHMVGDPSAPEFDSRGRKRGNSWGIDIDEIRVKSPGFPHAVNTALAERAASVSKAMGQARATVIDSEAKKTATINASEGEATATGNNAVAQADATIKTADAQAHKIKVEGDATAGARVALGKATGTKGAQLVARLEALKEGFGKGNTVILDANMGVMTDVLKGAAAIKAVNVATSTSPGTTPTP